MRFFLRLFGIAIISLPFILAALLYSSVQQTPLVTKNIVLKHSDIARAKKIIAKNDPRKLREGQKKSVTVSAQDISVALNYLRAQVIKGGVETKLSDGAINLYGTALLPDNPIGKYLNVELALVQEQQQLAVEQLKIGSVSIPGFLVEAGYSFFTASEQGMQLAAITNMLQSAQISHDKLQLSYIWHKDALDRVKGLVLTGQDKQVLMAYQQQLANITRGFSANRKYSLIVLLEPLFSFAAERSVHNDPVVENRALLSVLAAYANGHSLKRLTGEAGAKSKRLKLYLHKRHDFVQHFTISAGLAVQGGKTLADAVGLYKEYADKKTSSGFSFTDLAADRAGVRLAELATASKSSAYRIQRHMSGRLTEATFMPRTRDLPEGLSATAFQRKYQGGKGLAYQRVVDLIEQRIDDLAINR
ncbi:MAG: hypothetical protein methR_P2705 [Methyloprofundus sp.]|nr:MAG: hypothetical protein methR_P2705 [Methyloprofundus sp.]